jgi:hypothetical protein
MGELPAVKENFPVATLETSKNLRENYLCPLQDGRRPMIRLGNLLRSRRPKRSLLFS